MDYKYTTEQLLRWGRGIVHCSHEGDIEKCQWPYCKEVNKILQKLQELKAVAYSSNG